MEVQNIKPFFNNLGIFNKKTTETKENKNHNQETTKFAKLPSTKNYLAFTGGYSLSLSDTIKNLDEKAFPPDIREMIQKEIENKNPENKTLIDIHREKYGKINKLRTLDEIKKEFPEFENVKSDSEVSYCKNSFMDDVKSGRMEWFDPEVDLSVQLLQMYWADGFSLSSLKEFTNGKEILGVLEKLNIPRLNRNYANVLKLSDKEYNERFTSEMSKRLTGIQKKKVERKNSGLSAPRGPMSEEQKQKISEGLLRYYSEHPEKSAENSERMKALYEKCPELRELFSEVLCTAWELRESKSIRKKMSKFMGRDITPQEYAKMSLDNSSKSNGKTLAEFWERNSWAKEQWSKSMKKAWAIVKDKKANEGRPVVYSISLYPKDLQKSIVSWAKENGYDYTQLTNFDSYLSPEEEELKLGDVPQFNPYTSEVINAYIDSDETAADTYASMLEINLFKTYMDLRESRTPENSHRGEVEKKVANFIEEEILRLLSRRQEYTTTGDLRTIILSSAYFAVMEGEPGLISCFERNLDYSYMLAKNANEGRSEKAKKEVQGIMQKGLTLIQQKGFERFARDLSYPVNI